MLTSTFCHIPGIGEKTERSLWSAGITSWEAIGRQARPGLSGAFRPSWADHLEESRSQYAVRNPDYFYERLPASQHWRLYRDFQDTCAYIDIETTGLSWSAQITTIALYDGRSIRHYVSGRNLDAFARDVRAYRLLVTYNGKCFDVPFLERRLGARLPAAHIDLRYTVRSLGLRGGLKGCERGLGIGRPGLEEIDGFAAVLLWDEYRRGQSERALETLLAYNVQDAVNLQALMIHAYNAKVRQTPFGNQLLPSYTPPEVPFRPDPEAVQRVLGERLRLLAFYRDR